MGNVAALDFQQLTPWVEAEHQRWRHEVEYAMLEEILDEVQNLPPRRNKPGRLFLELPEHMRESRPL